MRINLKGTGAPIQEDVDNNSKVRSGMVKVSDGKSKPVPMRLQLSTECLKLQKEELVPVNRNVNQKASPTDSRARIVPLRRQKVGGLGLSIKGGAEHNLPIMISRIFKGQAADQTGELFVGDAVIKVNGELITHCYHDEAVNILRNAGDLVMLTVKHYRAATPFLQKTSSDEENGLENTLNGGDWSYDEKTGYCNSLDSVKTVVKWIDYITVPLMMAYVTRYIFGTDKLRPNAFEVRGLNGVSTGIVHCDEAAVFSQWLKHILDNIAALMNLQMKLYNRNFPASERIEYMGWVNEGTLNNNQPWQNYRPRFLTLKGTDVLLFDTPPLNIGDWLSCDTVLKVYQSMLRIIKESENVDERQHCFLLQTSGQESRYFSVETRQDLLRIESAWHCSVCAAVMKLGSKTFNVTLNSNSGIKPAGLTLDWNMGFALYDTQARAYAWQYKFSQLRGSSDDGKSRLKLHFQDNDTRAIETKEFECSALQALLFCMHAFLTAKVASVDPAFLSSRSP
ncbi:unnamed protein product [Bemisia tabaci]|uniref:PDZ domain-containing protein n=1 Tax=Bemisia tabaci TaxID=7038 RepID=A0A9P0AHF8_BEMTA|nr:PREDICTED: gamma-1-syntrophin [Bemisia tabaci]CAH0390615.1 unnamed protein product [Bemisia tabaci]